MRETVPEAWEPRSSLCLWGARESFESPAVTTAQRCMVMSPCEVGTWHWGYRCMDGKREKGSEGAVLRDGGERVSFEVS